MALKTLILIFALFISGQAKAFDLGVHENQRGIAAHFGVGAAFQVGLITVLHKSNAPMWLKMTCGIIGAVAINSIYEAATNKDADYFMAMDVAAGAGAFAVGGVAQLGYWEGENRISGIALRIPFK